MCRRSVLFVAATVVVLLPAAPGAQVALGTAISYYDVTNGNLKVAHCGNTACSPFVVGRR